MADENDDNNTPTPDETPAQPVVEDASAAETHQPVAAEPDAAPQAATDEQPAEPQASAEAEAQPEQPAQPEASAQPEQTAEVEQTAEPEAPKPVTAVSLGLLPEVDRKSVV